MKTTFDIQRIKDQLPPLSVLFARDGYPVRRSGTAFFAPCPFHDEKSPSCQVSDDTGRFHCFGCAASGDAFDYWQKSRGLSFQDSLAQLAGMAGVGPATSYAEVRKIAERPRPKAEETPPEPLSAAQLAEWQTACESLAGDAAEIRRIATWRGIEPDAVAWAAREGLMGAFRYRGQTREAFLVEMPGPLGRIPVSVHVRLHPGSAGNETATKASWRFTPSGCGSWPFIIGNPATAAAIFLVEGQWDAIALTSMMGWHRREKWPSIAVVGLRGATSQAKALKHTFQPKAQVIAIADADGAGARWFEEDGVLEQLESRVRAVTAFWPTTEKKDLNDLIADGSLTRDLLANYLQPYLAPHAGPPRGPTFSAWCKTQTNHENPAIRRAAAHVTEDKAKLKGRRPLRHWIAYWARQGVPEDLAAELQLTFIHYREATSKS